MMAEFAGGAKYPVRFEAMVKAGEQYWTTTQYAPGSRWDKEASRPRMIFVPAKEMCGNLARMNEPLIDLLKAVEPSFIHGMNTQ